MALTETRPSIPRLRIAVSRSLVISLFIVMYAVHSIIIVCTYEIHTISENYTHTLSTSGFVLLS